MQAAKEKPDRQFEGPVFIVGMNGSGTTMMLDHLDRHPKLFGFRLETYVLPHYLLSESRYGDLASDKNYRALWNDMRSEYPFRRANKGKPMELPGDWAEPPRHAGTVFNRIMREFAQREGKTRWCEKTPMYALHMEMLGKAFSESLFIHMVRDGRDCAASNYRRWGRHPGGTINRWKHVVTEGRRQGRRLGDRYLEVRYEDLTDNPEQHMRRVCAFLSVTFDNRILLADRPRFHMAGVGSKTIVKVEKRSDRDLSANTRQYIEKVAGKQLAAFGYDTGCPDSDFEPGRASRTWWFTHDAVAIFMRQVKKKLTVQKRMTWPLFYARLKATLRQVSTSTSKGGLGRRKGK